MSQMQTGQGGSTAGNNGVPAWQSILDSVPDIAKPAVEAAFKQWDAATTQQFQQIHNQYAQLKPYEAIAKAGINPDRVAQALQFADQLEKDPAEMLGRINTTFKLGFVPESQVQKTRTPNSFSEFDDLEDGNNVSLADNPEFKAMMQAVTQVQEMLQNQQQEKTEEQQIQAFEEYLDTLLENQDHVDRMVITAFMTQGNLTGEQALERYNEAFAGNLNTQQTTVDEQSPYAAILANANNGQQQVVPNQAQQAPVVMGGDGTVGSGTATQPINFGGMKVDDLNSAVADLLAKSEQT